jgi:ribosome-associated protein
MPGPLRVTRSVVIPDSELRWRFSRSSGPGGQHVNTSDSRVELTWDVTGSKALGPVLRERAVARLADRLVDGTLTVSASEERSQLRNRESAEAKLVDLVRAAVAPPPRARRATKPSRGSVERRLGAKKRRSDVKRDRRRPTD